MPVAAVAELVLVLVTAELTEPVADVAGPVELVAEVTVLAAEVAADVTGAAAGVLVLVAAEVPEPELVLVPVAAVAELVVVPVTAEVTEPMADVTGPVAEVSGPVAVGGGVAACAWRENASKATMIPAATIATCTARRAMSRTIGCGMSSSRTTGDRPDPARNTSYQRPETRGGQISPGTGYLRSAAKCTVRPPPYRTRPSQARDPGHKCPSYPRTPLYRRQEILHNRDYRG